MFKNSRKIDIVFIWLCLLAALAVFQDAPAYALVKTTTFSYQPLHVVGSSARLMTVKTKIDGSTAGELLIDTATNIDVISKSAAAKLHLVVFPYTYHGKPYLMNGSATGITLVKKLQAGTMVWRNQPFLVVKNGSFQLLGHSKVVGIVGFESLSAIPMILDPLHQTISFCNSKNLTDSEVNSLGFKNSKVVPLTTDKMIGLSSVTVTVTSHHRASHEELRVDTGSPETIISSGLSTRLKLNPKASYTGQTFQDGTVTVGRVALSSIKIGALQISNPHIHAFRAKGSGEAPRLGMDILSQYRVLLDYADGQMYLLPQEPTQMQSTVLKYVPITSLAVQMIAIPAIINGSVHGRFLIDTGSNMSLLTAASAQRFGLIPHPYLVNEHPFLYNGQPSQAVSVSDLTLGNFIIPQRTFLIATPGGMASSLQSHNLDGIIGLDLLSSFGVEIQPEKHDISFYLPGNLKAAKLSASGWPHVTVVPMHHEAGSDMESVSVTYTHDKNQVRRKCFLDTGLPYSFLADNIALQLKLTDPLIGNQEEKASITHPTTLPINMKIGSMRFSDPSLMIGSAGAATYNTIGMNILSGCDFLLDFPAKKMYLAPESTPVTVPPPGPSTASAPTASSTPAAKQ